MANNSGIYDLSTFGSSFVGTIYTGNIISTITNSSPVGDLYITAYNENERNETSIRLTQQRGVPLVVFGGYVDRVSTYGVRLVNVLPPEYYNQGANKGYVDDTINNELSVPPHFIYEDTYALTKQDVYPILIFASENDQLITLSLTSDATMGRAIRLIKLNHTVGILRIQADADINILYSGNKRQGGIVKILPSNAGSIVTLTKIESALWIISGPVVEDI